MEQKTMFEQLDGTYSGQGDYLLPDVKLPERNIMKSVSGVSAAGSSLNSTTASSITICLRSVPSIPILQKSTSKLSEWKKRL